MLGITINGVRGQPALLYLVPCTLGTLSFMAWFKGEFVELWKGPNMRPGEDMRDDSNLEAPDRSTDESGVAYHASTAENVASSELTASVDADVGLSPGQVNLSPLRPEEEDASQSLLRS